MSERFTPHNPESGVEQSSEQMLQSIEAQFGEYGFEDFRRFLTLLPTSEQEDFLRDFLACKDDETFQQIIEREWLPYDAGSFEDCRTRMGLIMGINETGDVVDERRELDRETEDVVDETGDVVDETEGVVDETEGVVEYRETEIVNITQTLIENWRQKGIYNDILAGLPADAGHEEQLQLILDNYVTILERAREHSDTEFVAVYEGLQRLERSGVELPDIGQFASYYREIEQSTINPESSIGRSSREDARLVLDGGGNFRSISGNTLIGENGEYIEIDGRHIDLALVSEGGLSLDVGSFERPRTRELEAQESRLRTQLEANNQRLGELEDHENELSLTRERYETIPDVELETEAYQDAIATQFSAITGNRLAHNIVRAIEQGIDGSALKRLLVGYIDEQLQDISVQKEGITQENTKLENEIGKLVSRIETQRRLFAERVAFEREQVEKTRNFYERIGVSSILGRIQGLLGRISPGFPVRVGDNTITGFNPATFQFEGTFSPPLGDQNPADTLTQDVFLQLINQSLNGSIEEPFIRGATGSIIYKLDGETVGPQEFERRFAPIIGSPYFEAQVLANWGQISTDESSVGPR